VLDKDESDFMAELQYRTIKEEKVCQDVPEDVRIDVWRITGFLFLFPLQGGLLTQYTSVFREG